MPQRRINIGTRLDPDSRLNYHTAALERLMTSMR
jgi:hypothetical protein